jgi:C-terminal processing protease CtpA/Prc
VAVLTGPRTASSGEAVTVSIRGRPRTRSFGDPTRGLSTANQGFVLPDRAALILTVSVYEDRTGRRYGEQIAPDEVVPYTDAAVQRAREWLARSSGCRAAGS